MMIDEKLDMAQAQGHTTFTCPPEGLSVSPDQSKCFPVCDQREMREEQFVSQR